MSFAVCCGRTSERLPCRNLSTMSRFSSAFYKHSNTSLQQNQHVCTCSGSGSVSKTNCQFIICLCASACDVGDVGYLLLWIVYDIPAEWESDEKQTCILTSKAAAKKKIFEGRF